MPRKKKKLKNIINDQSGILFIIFIILVTFLIVAYFTWWSDDTTAINNAQEKNPEKINQNINEEIEIDVEEDIYTENNLDFVVKGYSENEVVKTTNEDITNYNFNNEGNISIMPIDYEAMIKNSVGIKSETEITINGQAANKIIGSSAKDGSLITIILLKKEGQLYVFKGSDEFLNNLDKIINFKD